MRNAARLAATLLLASASVPPARGAGATPRVIRVVAKRFDFAPSEIRVKKGESVVLELVSEDRVHGFKLPAFQVRTDVRPKDITRVPLSPDRTGTFTFACDVFCGDGHDDMSGTLVVTD